MVLIAAEPDDEEILGAKDIKDDVGDGVLKFECMELDQAASIPPGGSGQSVVRSAHPGGAMVAMADGSVHFISSFIDTSEFAMGNGFTKVQLEDPTIFRTWQRLSISRDSQSVTTEF